MKKTLLSSAAFALLLSFLFIACGKELSSENIVTNGGTALYSLDGGTGSCTGATLSGTFTAGTPATAANTVTLSVTVDSVGSYIITTNKINGISFSGTGVFTSTGVQDIILTASGTPTAAGTFEFKPGADGCTFSVTVVANNGGSSGTGTYTFNGGTSSCTGASVSGTFTAGTAASGSVVLNIVVNTLGSYSISTNTVNGIKFTGSGTFTTTGAQTITLTASGTPASAGTFAFIPGSNGCTFNVTVAGSGGGGGGSGSNFLKCKIDDVLTNFNTGLVGYYVSPPSAGIPYSISVQGKNSDVAGSLQELWVSVTNPTSPTTGVYNNRTFSTGITDRGSQVIFYPTGFPNIYWGSSAFTANTLTVNITSVSTSGAAGTFSGTIYESNGLGPATKQVTAGEFKITF